MGMSYSAWADKININGNVRTGIYGSYVECNLHSPQITCRAVRDDVLSITLKGAPAGTYYCDFSFINDGTLPDRIYSVIITPRADTPPTVSFFTTGIVTGTVVDPGTAVGTLYITPQTAVDVYLNIRLVHGLWNIGG